MPFILWLKYNPSAAARPCITEDSAGVEPSTCPGQSVKVMNPPVCKHTQKSSLARTTHAHTHTHTIVRGWLQSVVRGVGLCRKGSRKEAVEGKTGCFSCES